MSLLVVLVLTLETMGCPVAWEMLMLKFAVVSLSVMTPRVGSYQEVPVTVAPSTIVIELVAVPLAVMTPTVSNLATFLLPRCSHPLKVFVVFTSNLAMPKGRSRVLGHVSPALTELVGRFWWRVFHPRTVSSARSVRIRNWDCGGWPAVTRDTSCVRSSTLETLPAASI